MNQQIKQISRPQVGANKYKFRYLIIALILAFCLINLLYSQLQSASSLVLQQQQLRATKELNHQKRQKSAPNLCRLQLPYVTAPLNHNLYYTWFGKVGTSTSGRTYLTGHIIQEHFAVNNKCTTYQLQNKKTVFYDEYQFSKAIKLDQVICDFSNATKFTYDENRVISAPSDYIKGIDCSKGPTALPQMFSQFFIQYKRAVQNSSPSQQAYMASTITTIWTFYPKR